MIAFVRGNFIVKNPALVIVDVNGVGYECHISLNTFSAIDNKESGQLFTYLHLYENGQTLYGFAEQSEKDLFIQLISVSGVGAATARMMLSGLRPEEIIRAIVQSNARQLESVKGIGKKTAERLVLELKDKAGTKTDGGSQNWDKGINSPGKDATNALIALGIAPKQAEQSVQKILTAEPEITKLEDLIKKALKAI